MISTIGSLRASKAAGRNAFPAKLVKYNIDILDIHLPHVFSHSVESAIYPYKLKIAKVVLVFKDGDPSEP